MGTKQNRKPDTEVKRDGRPRAGRANLGATTRRARVAPSFIVRIKESSGPGQPSPVEVARRAFLLYLQRGGQPGHDLDDWLQAERDLIAEGRNDADVA